MPSNDTLFVFTLAALALGAAPGPANLYVMTRSMAQGRGAGVVSALGLAVGGLVHTAAAAAGLSAMLAHVPAAYEAVRFAGAAYLIYLGIRMVLARGTGLPRQAAAAGAGLARIFGQGVVIEVLNPKTALFFISFLPQFVDPGAGAVATQLLVLGAIVPVAMLPVDLVVALSGGALGGRLARSAAWRRGLAWLSGTVLVGLGLRVALGERV